MAEVSEKDLFQRVDLSHTADREKIASPSLNFLQDSWRRLTKNIFSSHRTSDYFASYLGSSDCSV